MPCFLIEGYLPSRQAGALEALTRKARAAETTSVDKQRIRYLGSVVVPADETYFHLFEAPSAAELIEAGERVELGCERVAEALRFPREEGSA